VRHVASGRSLIDPSVTSRVFDQLRAPTVAADPLAHLTPQERRILEYITEGMTNREIAEQMFLAEKTVKNYVSNLLSKLGMARRAQAAVYAARLLGGNRP
jgi:DNA-binding NarL/FixJ family response regulator